MENKVLEESELTLIAAAVKIEGTLEIAEELHLFGGVQGEIRGAEKSRILLKPGSWVEGRIEAETIIIDGLARGEIVARKKVQVTSFGKVFGTVKTPSLQVDPGALFEAKVEM